MEETSNTKISLWKQPGSNLAKFGLFATGGLLVYGLAKAMMAVLPGLIVLGILFMLMTPGFRKAIEIFYLQMCRKLTGLVVTIDPIVILEKRVKEMRKKLDIVIEKITEIEAISVGMKDKLQTYERQFKDNVNDVKILEDMIRRETNQETLMGLHRKLTVAQTNVTLLNEQRTSQAARIELSDKYLEALKKLENSAKTKIGVGEVTLSHKKDEYEQAKKMKKAMSSFKDIFDESYFAKSIEEQMAITEVSNTINESIAEMNRLLDGSNDLLLNHNIANISNASKAAAIISEYEGKAQTTSQVREKVPVYLNSNFIEVPTQHKSIEHNYFK